MFYTTATVSCVYYREWCDFYGWKNARVYDAKSSYLKRYKNDNVDFRWSRVAAFARSLANNTFEKYPRYVVEQIIWNATAKNAFRIYSYNVKCIGIFNCFSTSNVDKFGFRVYENKKKPIFLSNLIRSQ